MALQVRNLLLQFDPTERPLIDISVPFGFEPGPALLVAPSGSGKTTLLRLLSGWYSQGDGAPSVARIDANFDPLRDVAFIGNHQTLLPWYSVRRNIALQSAGAGAVAEAYWSEVGLPAEAIDRFPYELSLGMYKRAELVCALCGRARLLLLDEFFSSLDPAARELALSFITRLQTEARTVLITTHSPEAFSEISRRYRFDVAPNRQIVGVMPL